MVHCLKRHYFQHKTPTECQLCNRKLKSKCGYTLHLKRCSQNVHVLQQNKTEIISPMTTAPPLPTLLPTIVSPTLITPTDTMKTSPTALTTVSTALTCSTPIIITKGNICPHHTDEASKFPNDSFPSLTHSSYQHS